MQQKPGAGASYSMAIMTVHLFTLFAFVVSRPVFTILVEHPGYIVANNMRAPDVYIAVLLLIVVIPLILTGLVFISGVFGKKFRLFIQTLLCAGLVSIFTLHLLSDINTIHSLIKLMISGVVFVFFAYLYYKKPKFSQVITALSPVVILFPLLFLFNPEIKQIMQAEAGPGEPGAQNNESSPGKKPPIMMVVFDELPLVDLLDAKGGIDANRFPNFARLGSESTWYKNATTVSYATQVAVPALLSGQRPSKRRLPIASEYPGNLFSSLDGHYSFHVIEPITRLFDSPQTNAAQPLSTQAGWIRAVRFLSDMSIVYLHIVLPRELSFFLPVIDEQWGGFLPLEVFRADQKNRKNNAMTGDRLQPLLSFISDIGSYPQETLHFIHVMLPHRPFQYLPSGRIYSDQDNIKGLSFTKDKASKVVQGEELLIDRYHQKHLLQTAFVDELLGQLIAEMKSAQIYDDSLLIVLADHGISFQQGVPVRFATHENFGEVAFVPLFIKYPSQDMGTEVDENAETIDILPTIIDVLDLKTTNEYDGQSLLDNNRRFSKKKILRFGTKPRYLIYNEKQYLAAKRLALKKNIARFSLDDPRSDLFNFGAGLDLIGAAADKLPYERLPCSIESEMIGELTRVDPADTFLPTEITGKVSCGNSIVDQTLLVVAVNGVIRGVTRPYSFGGEVLFNMILSDQVFLGGANDIDLFVISRT